MLWLLLFSPGGAAGSELRRTDDPCSRYPLIIRNIVAGYKPPETAWNALSPSIIRNHCRRTTVNDLGRICRFDRAAGMAGSLRNVDRHPWNRLMRCPFDAVRQADSDRRPKHQ
jgi:hypothetical protein